MANARPQRVAILSPGDMGAGVGSFLHAAGIDVIGCLTGRSALTRLRAEEAGFRDVGSLDDLIKEADLILSILVPSEATAMAEAVAAAVKRTSAHPVYADCNAIAPATVHNIEQLMTAAGAKFIDAGIVGGPPSPGKATARFHCSGPDTSAFEALGATGMDVRVVGPRIGQASGLKMLYAASTKGTTALWTEILTASRALGLEDALLGEWGDGVVSTNLMRGIPMMPHRSRRWVGEMEEIAATFEAVGLTPRMLEGAADMYRFVGSTVLGDQTPREADPPLDRILEVLAARLTE